MTRQDAEWRFKVFFSLCISQNINSASKAWREARGLFKEGGVGFSEADASIFLRLGQQRSGDSGIRLS